MSLPAQPRRYTLEEYFEIERRHEARHEYRDGYVVNLNETISMAGGGIRHSQITVNVITALGNRLKGSPCRVYSSDLRVRIPRRTLWAYPDATVICGTPQVETIAGVGETATNPQLIVEVLSPSTEAFDRGLKFERYREFDSLREYVLVSQSSALIEVFHRADDGSWSFNPVTGVEAHAQLRSLRIELPLAEVYDGVQFENE